MGEADEIEEMTKSTENSINETCKLLQDIHSINKKSADETLIDLGYEKMDLPNSEYYYNLQKNRDWIEFVKNSTIKVRADLTIQELQAINEKVKELRLDRRRR